MARMAKPKKNCPPYQTGTSVRDFARNTRNTQIGKPKRRRPQRGTKGARGGKRRFEQKVTKGEAEEAGAGAKG
jgi:hypothetical protein